MAKDRFDIKLFVHRGNGGGLTPLIDADGKPIVTKDSYQK